MIQSRCVHMNLNRQIVHTDYSGKTVFVNKFLVFCLFSLQVTIPGFWSFSEWCIAVWVLVQYGSISILLPLTPALLGWFIQCNAREGTANDKMEQTTWNLSSGNIPAFELNICYSWVFFSSYALLLKCSQIENASPFKCKQDEIWHHLPTLSGYLIIFQIQTDINGFHFTCYLVMILNMFSTIKLGLWMTIKLWMQWLSQKISKLLFTRWREG